MYSIRTIGAIVVAMGMALGASAQETKAEEQKSGDAISKSAAVYATYQSEVTDVKTKPLGSASDIDHALNSLGGHNPDQLSQGWISYSAAPFLKISFCVSTIWAFIFSYAFTIPSGVPIRISGEWRAWPSHTPFAHLSSKAWCMSLATSGMRYSTISPNGTTPNSQGWPLCRW